MLRERGSGGDTWKPAWRPYREGRPTDFGMRLPLVRHSGMDVNSSKQKENELRWN